MLQGKVEENLQKQAQLMEVIQKNQAAYKQAFGFEEWRRACEVRGCSALWCALTLAHLKPTGRLATAIGIYAGLTVQLLHDIL